VTGAEKLSLNVLGQALSEKRGSSVPIHNLNLKDYAKY
jgi:hypothetical protein